MSSLTTEAISQDQCATFRFNGFLAMRELASAGEVGALREDFTRLHTSTVGSSAGDRRQFFGGVHRKPSVTTITNLSRYSAVVSGSPVRARAFEIACKLLGDDLILEGETMVVKDAKSPDATPWHQDESFWDPGTTRDAVMFCLALQDIPVNGACMEYIPGSHRGPLLPHRAAQGSPQANALEIDDLDARFRVVCPVPAGGATIHHGRLAHATGPNHSDTARYVYVMTFTTPTRSVLPTRSYRWSKDTGRTTVHRSLANKLIDTTLRKASAVVVRLNALNDRRCWKRTLA